MCPRFPGNLEGIRNPFTDPAFLPHTLATEQWDEDPAVVAWSIAPEPVPQEEATVWPFEGLGQLQPPPVEIPYHGES